MNETLFLVSLPANQDKAPVAIAAIDIAALINLQPDFGVAKCGGDIAAAITGNTGVADADFFGFIAHICAVSKA
jgi:hypothetical protein